MLRGQGIDAVARYHLDQLARGTERHQRYALVTRKLQGLPIEAEVEAPALFESGEPEQLLFIDATGNIVV